MVNPCAVYDFRCNASDYETYTDVIKNLLDGVAKAYTFQLEQGDGGYKHWQGRMSLIKRRRKAEIMKLLQQLGRKTPNYLEPTSSAEALSGESFYVQKADTRIDGPWTDKDKPVYIPRQIREISSLYSWQQTIVDSLSVWDKRHINLVYCPDGNKGKTTLVGWCRAYKLARVLPPVNDSKDLLRMVCDCEISQAYMFDMPRAMNKDRLYGFYQAIETIKDGYAYDDRYKFQEKVFDCPVVWIFSNTLPDKSLLSGDRWHLWEIKENELRRIPENFFLGI